MKYLIILTLAVFSLASFAGNGDVKETVCEKINGGTWDHRNKKCIGGKSDGGEISKDSVTTIYPAGAYDSELGLRDRLTIQSDSVFYSCSGGILYADGQSTGVAGMAVCTNDGGEVWLSCSGDRLVAFRFRSCRYCEG